MVDENPDHVFTAEFDTTPPHMRPCVKCKGEGCILCIYTGKEVERLWLQERRRDTYQTLEQLNDNTHQYLTKEDLEEAQKTVKVLRGKSHTVLLDELAVKVAELAYKRGIKCIQRWKEEATIFEAENDFLPLTEKLCSWCMGISRECLSCGGTGRAVVENANAKGTYKQMVQKIRGRYYSGTKK